MSEQETGRIRTNFLDNQAREISKPAIGKTQIGIAIGIVVLVIGFCVFQAVSYIMNLGKINAVKSALVTLDHPGMLDGVAQVDVIITNLNPSPISQISFRYNILGPTGTSVASNVVAIPGAVPAGDQRIFRKVKLGPLTEQASRMQAEIVDLKLGPKSKLNAEQESRFTEIAGLKDEEKQPEFEKFVKDVPDFVPSYIELARAYMATNDYEKAVKVLKKAVEIDPKDGDAHYQLAVALQHNGQKKEAGQELKQAFEMLPDDPDVQRTVQYFNPLSEE